MRGGKEPVVEPHSIVHVKQPMVRDYATHGGHAPGDRLIEGARKTITKKWQGYPPDRLSVIGTLLPALPERSEAQSRDPVAQPKIAIGQKTRVRISPLQPSGWRDICDVRERREFP